MALLSVTMLGLTSCNYDIRPFDQNILPDTVSFSEHIVPIFQVNCVMTGCHASQNGVPPDLGENNAWYNLIAYGLVDTLLPEGSELYLRLTSDNKPMPPDGRLEKNTTDLVLLWITQGAKNN